MKTQMRFQKILALTTLIIAALTVVYALIFFSGSIAYIYNNLDVVNVTIPGATIVAPSTTITFDINATHFYEVAQNYNSLIFILGIVFLLFTVTLYITASNSRRNYYITNYISIIAVAAFAVIFAVIAIALLTNCLNLFVNEIDWNVYEKKYNFDYVNGTVGTWTNANGEEELMYWYNTAGTTSRPYPYYSDSKTMFIIGYVVYAVVILDAVALVLNLIWKIKLMQGEKQLLANGLIKEVA
jgi:hypothetical protein